MTALTRDTVSTSSMAGRVRSLRSLLLSQEAILALTLLALIILVGLANPRFVAPNNMANVFSGEAYIAIAAIGMSMVIISGNIDISVGQAIAVMATVCGTLATNGVPVWLSWLIPLAVGALIGAVNGFFVAYLRMPAIVVTLGMYSILRGGLIAVTGGTTIYDLPPGFGLAQEKPFGIPSTIWIMIILTIGAALWMRYSPTGRAIYAVGGNREAAIVSGISARRTIMTAFILNGVFAGVAAVLYATQFTSIQVIIPPSLELGVITAAVVGGVSILGGTGTVIGSTLAAILLNAIRNSMVFVDVSAYWIRSVQGFLILVTVLVDVLRRRQLRR